MTDKIVCVEWDDASFHSGYYDKRRPEDFEPVCIKTVGFLVKRTKKAVIVAHERIFDSKGKRDDDRHISTIPKKMIRKIVKLEISNGS